MGTISKDNFKRRFVLAHQPKGTCKEEINRLFTARHINSTTFSDCTDFDETMYYRLKSKDEAPKLATIITLCVGLSLDTLTGYRLVELAGYKLLPDNRLHCVYAYFMENSTDLTVAECNDLLRDMGYRKKGERLGSTQRAKTKKSF